MRKFAAIVGTILICIGVIFSTMFWIVIIDSGSVRHFPFGNPSGPIISTIVKSALVIFMPAILVGIPVTIYGFFTRFSYRMAFMTGFLFVSVYGIFWLIIALTAPD